MILYKKLISHFNTNELKELLGEETVRRFKTPNYRPSFPVLCEKIDVERIGYFYEDFLQDYKLQIAKYKEKEILYNIWKQGFSVYKYSIKVGLKKNSLYRILRKGREIVKDDTKYKLLDTFKVDYDLTDLQAFQVEVFHEYCKLYGEKNELEKFTEKYKIDFPVLYYNGKYSVAFNGWFFKVIQHSQKEVLT